MIREPGSSRSASVSEEIAMHKLVAAVAISQLAAISPQSPSREPQLAAAKGITAMAFGSGTSISVSVSADDGARFGKPVRIATAPVVPLTRHRGPRIVISGNTLVVTAVVGETAAAGEHAHGNLFAAWLDKRGKGTRLYGVWSPDSGATWTKIKGEDLVLWNNGAEETVASHAAYPNLVASPAGGAVRRHPNRT